MTTRSRTLIAALALLASGLAGSAMLVGPGAAQVATDGGRAPMVRPLPGRHIEGRLAFLRTELKISDAQGAAWDRYAALLRQRAARLSGQMRSAGDAPVDLVTRMERRADFATQQAAALREELEAFRPLYAAMSEEQKRTADELLGHHFGHRR